MRLNGNVLTNQHMHDNKGFMENFDLATVASQKGSVITTKTNNYLHLRKTMIVKSMKHVSIKLN